IIWMKLSHFRDDFSNAFVTKRQTDRLRREAKAPEYGALQTLRAIWLRLGRAEEDAPYPLSILRAGTGMRRSRASQKAIVASAAISKIKQRRSPPAIALGCRMIR